MLNLLKKYETPEGIVEAEPVGSNIQYGLKGSKIKELVAKAKFLKLVKIKKWKEIENPR